MMPKINFILLALLFSPAKSMLQPIVQTLRVVMLSLLIELHGCVEVGPVEVDMRRVRAEL